MNNKMTLVESMTALRKQLHTIESQTVQEGLKDAVSAAKAGEEIIPSILKFWLKKPAVEIIKEFKTIEITLPNGTKEVWNATGIKKGEAVYSRAGDNAVASFDDITKSGTVKNITNDLADLRDVTKPQRPKARKNEKGEWEVQNEKGEWVKYEKPAQPASSDEIKQVDVSGPDSRGRIEPTLFKNIGEAKAAADAEIQAGNAIVKAPDGSVFKSAEDIESFIAKNYPETAAVLKSNPKKSMGFWSWFSKPAKTDQPYPAGTIGSELPGGRPSGPRDVPRSAPTHRKKTILLVAVLIALGIYFWPKDKTSPAGGGGGGGGSSDDVSPAEAARANAALGKHMYGINAENIDWNKAGMPELTGQRAERTPDGKWTSQDGTEITSPKAIKALVKAYHDSPPTQFSWIPADSGGVAAGEPTVTVPSMTATQTDVANPDAIQVDPNFDGKIKSSKSKAR